VSVADPEVAAAVAGDIDRRAKAWPTAGIEGDSPTWAARAREVEVDLMPGSARALEHGPFRRLAYEVETLRIQVVRKFTPVGEAEGCREMRCGPV